MPDRVVSYDFRANFVQFTAGLTAMGRGVQDVGVKLTALDKNGAQMRRGLDSIGRTAGRVGLVAAAGLGAAVLAAANFDSAMSKVSAATHETAGNMDLLRAAAIKAGADTVFSATEAADAITALAKAGVSTQDVLGGGLSGALSLASAGELDVASAAEIAATAMTQFGLSGRDIPHIADLLAAAAGKAQGEVTDMANSLKYVGPVAHQMGISIEETTGTIAELASQGILGEQAGTSLRGMLTSLTSPSKIAADQMAALGINLYDATGKFVGLDGVAGQLKSTMGGLTNQERDQALGRIFGNEQITAARILYAGGAEDVQKWTNAVNDQNYAAETAALKMDNLKGDIEQLSGSFQTLLITTGDGSQSPLRGIVRGATDATNALNSLPGPIKNTAASLLAITAITGGALWFGSKVVRGISDTRDALKSLGPDGAKARTGLSAATKGVAALTAGFIAFEAADSALHLSTTAADMARIISLLDAKAGPNLADQIKATEDAIKSAQQTADNANIHINLGFTDIYSSDKAAKAADTVDGLKNHLKDLQTQQKVGAAENEAYAATVTGVGNTAGKTVEEIKAMQKALEDARTKAGDTARSFFGLGDSVNDSKVSLSGWIADLEKQSAALRDFTKNAITAGQKGVKEGLIQELEAAGPAGALRLKELADASEAEIKRANRAWASGQKAIRAYIALTVPDKDADVRIKGIAKALADIRAVQRALNALNSSRGISLSNQGVKNDPANRASGGPIYGPGTATSDSIPAMLSNGEYVVQAAAVAKYGVGFFAAANQKRLAGGGSASYAASLNSASQVNTRPTLADYLRNDLDLKFPQTLKEWNAALKASTKVVDKEKDQRQKLLDQAQSVKDAIAGNYKSALFGQVDSSDLPDWLSSEQKAMISGGGLNGALSSLTSDIGNLGALKAAIAKLKAKGLDGAALADLLSNASLQQVQAFASGSQADVNQYESLYNQRSSLANDVGAAGAQAVNGAQLAVLNRTLAVNTRMERAMNRVGNLLEKNPNPSAADIAKAINGAITKGKGR